MGIAGRRGRKRRTTGWHFVSGGRFRHGAVGMESAPSSVQAEETEPVEQVVRTVSDGKCGKAAREALGEARRHYGELSDNTVMRMQRNGTAAPQSGTGKRSV